MLHIKVLKYILKNEYCQIFCSKKAGVGRLRHGLRICGNRILYCHQTNNSRDLRLCFNIISYVGLAMFRALIELGVEPHAELRAQLRAEPT